jgi:two-component system, OmpR family, phosphate regulon sensor histidine kinase PhoR
MLENPHEYCAIGVLNLSFLMLQQSTTQYWIAVAGRLAIIAVLALVAGTSISPLVGWVTAALGCLVYAINFAVSIYRTQRWITSDVLNGDLPNSPTFNSLASWLYRARRREHAARAAMDETLEKFQATLTRLPDGVVLLDAALNIQWCNPMAEHHLGIELTRDSGLRLTNLVREPAFVNAVLDVTVSEPFQAQLGQPPRTVQVTQIAFDSGERLMVTTDVSQAERLNRMRQDFIANVSHELRTPLTVIAGFLDLASPATPLSEQHLQLMRGESLRMRRLIDDLLTLSKLESSVQVVEEEEFELAPMISRLLDSVRALSGGQHQITLEGQVPQVKIKGSMAELESAASNLLSNAVRYTPAQGRISLVCKYDDDGLVIEVHDTGPGIAPEHLPRLAERFYRVDKSRSRETGGTGLGLAIVKHVMSRHQGALEVRSVLGQGSVFALRISPQRIIINA